MSRLLAFALVIVAGLAGAWWWFNRNPDADARPRQAPSVSAKMAAIAASENAPAPTNDALPESPPQPKSLDDLKPGPVTLEKARSGSLVHAVGTLRNESDHQRYGVKVEIEFTDARGRPAGKTTDYIQVIEPRKEWRFRALVLDSKAISGSVISVQEDR